MRDAIVIGAGPSLARLDRAANPRKSLKGVGSGAGTRTPDTRIMIRRGRGKHGAPKGKTDQTAGRKPDPDKGSDDR